MQRTCYVCASLGVSMTTAAAVAAATILLLLPLATTTPKAADPADVGYHPSLFLFDFAFVRIRLYIFRLATGAWMSWIPLYDARYRKGDVQLQPNLDKILILFYLKKKSIHNDTC